MDSFVDEDFNENNALEIICDEYAVLGYVKNTQLEQNIKFNLLR